MLGTLAILLATAGSATAAVCGPQQTTKFHLSQSFDEAPLAQGATTEGWLVQIWVSRDGKTWSMVALSPDGQSACLLATGDGWHPIPQGRPS